MKKLSTILAVLFFSSVAYAQTEIKPTIGINSTNVSQDPATGEATGKIGWQFGASVLIGNEFYIEPGLFYMHSTTDFSSTDDDFDFETQLRGLRLPVALGFHIIGNEESAIDLRVFGGPSAYFLTGVDSGPFDRDDFESTQFGLFAGAGLDLFIFFLDLKYEWSLTDLSSVQDFDIGQRRAFFTNAGIRLKL
jgi:hypothetical protein